MLTTKEVSRQLTKYYGMPGRYSARAIAKLCKQGKLPAQKVAGEWQIKEEDAAARLWPGVFDLGGGREG